MILGRLVCSEEVLFMHLSMSSPRGGGLGNPREFDCDVYPQGGDFDPLIFQYKEQKRRKPYF